MMIFLFSTMTSKGYLCRYAAHLNSGAPVCEPSCQSYGAFFFFHQSRFRLGNLDWRAHMTHTRTHAHIQTHSRISKSRPQAQKYRRAGTLSYRWKTHKKNNNGNNSIIINSNNININININVNINILKHQHQHRHQHQHQSTS